MSAVPSGAASWYTDGMDPLLSRITTDPAVCHGQPCVRGLRYPVEMLLDLLSSGMSFDDVLADYPDLERDDLRAVLAFAARLARSKRLAPAIP
jgi:uncharacterized protein (DUF433 family)